MAALRDSPLGTLLFAVLLCQGTLSVSSAVEFDGTFISDGGWNFKEYMKACGVSPDVQQAEMTGSVTFVVSHNDTHWKYTQDFGHGVKVQEFQLGVPHTTTTLSGTTVSTTISKWGEDYMVEEQSGPGASLIYRWFEDDYMTEYFTCNGVRAQRLYEREEDW